MTTLTDRYVFAALKSIPEENRDDIDRELRGSITDAIEARIDSGQAPAEAESTVLTEFGDPRQLAARYAEQPLYLVGPDLYLSWLRVLKLLLWIVGATSFVGVLVVRMAIEPQDPITAFSAALSACIGLLIQVAFWVTLVFAILQRTGVRRSSLGLKTWAPEMLPPIERHKQVSLADTIATVILLAFSIGLLLWQRVGSLLYLEGKPVLVLQEHLWNFWLPYLIAVLVLEAVFAVVLFAVGRWTLALAAVNLGVAVLFMIPALWLLATDQAFDWSFLSSVDWDVATARWIAGITAAAVVVLGLWDIASGFLKASRSDAQVVSTR
ncbi:permease prefix domain 1-containing protein [Mycetocola zhujimingii]|uniref:Uncharacterized protein n=1 Tax=Mycetocola zhujimingii TaxID=2079792 RepID=A0A2U1TAH2_9MICO|nr:permease prefix domain 1-containing protein [Mycetocola zhujimingii]PWC04678.1 hypothetical protein DF223_14660 [Mycetocola zhujimingii]